MSCRLLFYALHFIILLSSYISPTTAAWRPPSALRWQKYAQHEPPAAYPTDLTQADDLSSAAVPTARTSSEQTDPFASARHRLAVMSTSSTCKRLATIKLLTTCEDLQTTGSTHDHDLEDVQNLYAAHLAICELEGAGSQLPRACRALKLQSLGREGSRGAESEGEAAGGSGSPEVLGLDVDGKRKLKECTGALQTKAQWWTSYSNNRRDAYLWCKVMRPMFDQDEYARSLKEVIDANGEIASALEEFLEGNKKRMKEQREFMQEMEIFKLKLVRDLETSARDVSETFRWLTNQATDASRELLKEISASFDTSRVEAEGLSTLLSSSSTSASSLRDLIASTHRTLFDGISSISAAQETQLDRTNQQLQTLGHTLEYMIDTRVNAAVGNASEIIGMMTKNLQSMLATVENTQNRIEEVESKIGGLARALPLLGNTIAKTLSTLKWPFVAFVAVVAGWRSAMLIAASIFLLAQSPSTESVFQFSQVSATSWLDSINNSVLSLSLLRPIIAVLALFLLAYLALQNLLSPIKVPAFLSRLWPTEVSLRLPFTSAPPLSPPSLPSSFPIPNATLPLHTLSPTPSTEPQHPPPSHSRSRSRSGSSSPPFPWHLANQSSTHHHSPISARSKPITICSSSSPPPAFRPSPSRTLIPRQPSLTLTPPPPNSLAENASIDSIETDKGWGLQLELDEFGMGRYLRRSGKYLEVRSEGEVGLASEWEFFRRKEGRGESEEKEGRGGKGVRMERGGRAESEPIQERR